MEIPVPETILKGGTAYISDMVVQDFVFESGSNFIIFAPPKIDTFETIGIVGRIVIEPRALAGTVVGSVEIDMSVAEFISHIGQHLKELTVGHSFIESWGIPFVHLVPVQSVSLFLIVEETITLVQGFPQGLEIAAAGIVGKIFSDAGTEEAGDRKDEQPTKKSGEG